MIATDSNRSTLPSWISDSHIDPSWIREKLPNFQDASSCVVTDISNDMRKGKTPQEGTTLLLTITSTGNDENGNRVATETTMVAKQVAPSGLQLSRRLGLAREALFYEQLAPKLMFETTKGASSIPKIYYSYGDMSDGSKVVFMEDLSKCFVDSGILFGPGNPNNWSRNLEQKITEAYPNKELVPSSSEVANATFQAIANIHARFWKDSELLQEKYNWLRGSSWITGNGEKSWRESQGMLQSMWKNYTTSENDDYKKNERIHWDPLLREIVEKAMDGISWESHRRRLNVNSSFCLVHGDFWPGNIMIAKKTKTSSDFTANEGYNLRLLDWEMVGLGSGPQDLGQYVLSNMEPRERKESEERLVRNYHQKLVELGVIDLTWEECWFEYTVGGLERWIWFLVYFCSQGVAQPVMVGWAQFFHDQMKAFVHDHNISPDDVTQPRP